jgi:putative membrane protein
MSNRAITIINIALSVVIYAGLMWLIYAFELKEHWSDGLPWLPHFNAGCNATSATAVALGVWLIKRGKKQAHAAAMIFATLASAAFLVGYLTHHTLHGDTPFTGTGGIRVVYFAILISHIILSGVALPLILNTLTFAALRRFDAHRKIARWTYPIWLYVSVTGVIIWVFLRVWFPSPAPGG